jgi:hypothetical protein
MTPDEALEVVVLAFESLLGKPAAWRNYIYESDVTTGDNDLQICMLEAWADSAEELNTSSLFIAKFLIHIGERGVPPEHVFQIDFDVMNDALVLHWLQGETAFYIKAYAHMYAGDEDEDEESPVTTALAEIGDMAGGQYVLNSRFNMRSFLFTFLPDGFDSEKLHHTMFETNPHSMQDTGLMCGFDIPIDLARSIVRVAEVDGNVSAENIYLTLQLLLMGTRDMGKVLAIPELLEPYVV